jgi:ubiquinone/menaquinone biosynthesis C-methylase UbiE
MFQRQAKSDYQAIFNIRGDLYNAATRLCPGARETERQLLLNALKLDPQHLLCDAAAGGGYLAERALDVLPADRIVCIDPSFELVRDLKPCFSRIVSAIEHMPLPDGCMDRVACLTGLHHLEDKSKFFQEAFRLVRPDGVLAVADVLQDTPPARFLNGPCDRLSLTGHQGKFFAPGEAAQLIARAGFGDAEERYQQYTWDFPGKATLIEFCRLLFGLQKGSSEEVASAIDSHLKIDAAGNTARLHWSLVYAWGRKIAKRGHDLRSRID